MISGLALGAVLAVTAWPRPVPLFVFTPDLGPPSLWARVGDVDGDGREDLALSIPARDGGPVRERGWVGLVAGGPRPDFVWQRQGLPDENSGLAIAGLGDVDGDLFADVAIAVSDEAGDRIEVYLGGSKGLGDVPAWVDGGPKELRYGADFEGIGDVDGDGRADLAVVAFPDGVGRVMVHRGSPVGLEARVWFEVAGEGVEWAGDLDGDGRAEFVVSDAESSRVYRLDLASPPASPPRSRLLAELEPARIVGVGDLDGDGFMDLALVRGGVLSVVRGGADLADLNAVGSGIAAEWVAAAGDMNGDGHADLVIARGDELALVIGGVLQEPSRVREVTSLKLAGLSGKSDFGGQRIGGPLGPIGVGDFDGDGFGDVALPHGGGIAILRGVGTGLGTEPFRLVTPDWGPDANQGYGRADGFALDGADLNGDGFSDLLVGSPWAYGGAGRVDLYRGGSVPQRKPDLLLRGTTTEKLGEEVVAGGDADGDGFEDAWLGAPLARNGSFQNAGYIQAVRGGGAQLTVGSKILGGDYEGLGAQLGDRGDLDLDGRAELSLQRAGTTPELAVLFGNEHFLAASLVAQSVSNHQRPVVGDVDGDGRDDLVSGHLSRHIALLGPLGLGLLERSPPAQRTLVASAGDVDGDGDIEMLEITMPDRCPTDPVTFSRLGLVYGHPGFAFGPQVELHASTGCPGWSVDRAGDVDGDGYGDIIVGVPVVDVGHVPLAGRVFVHHGRSTGLEVLASWTVAGEGGGRRLGSAVAGAGDVDGDGFADVVVAGTVHAADAALGENSDRVLGIYFGNSGLGTRSAWHYAVLPLQPDRATPTPLPAGARSTSPTAFVVRARPASPFGRRVALEVEAKPHGMPFDGLGLKRSEFGISGSNTPLDTLVDGLRVDTAYKWRARLVTHPGEGPRQRGSHWIYGGRPGEAQGVHLRTRRNSPPQPKPLIETLAGSPFLRLAPGVLKDATDPDGDTPTARLGRPPVHGTVIIQPDGLIRYTPDPSFSGVDRFSYIASDGFGGETEAPIELTVPGPDGCGLVSDARCLEGDFFLVVHLDDGTLASIHCYVTADGLPSCDRDERGELRLGPPACGF